MGRMTVMTVTALVALAAGLLIGSHDDRDRADAATTGTLTVSVALAARTADGAPTRLDLSVRREGGKVVARRVGRRTLRLRLTPDRYVVRALRRRCAGTACKDPGRVLAACRRTVSVRAGTELRLTLQPRRGGCRFARTRSVSTPPPQTTTGTTPAPLPAGTGVGGRVTRRSGNCMPGTVDGSSTTCAEAPVSRELLVYSPPLPFGDFSGTTYTGPRQPSARATSQADGSYSVDLAPGSYSVLVADDGERYCNRFSETTACEVVVRSGERTRFDVVVDRGTQ